MKKFLKGIVGENTILIVKSFFKSAEEKELIKKRKSFYMQLLTSKNDIYYDVGANYGNRIEPIINEGLKIIAVEPQPKCVDFLQRKYGNKVTVVPKGLGETEGTQTMYISDAETLTSFSKDWINATKESGRFSQYNWNQEQAVAMTTLDNLITIHGKPKFLKIDVEGFEYEVLKGLTKPVETLSFEYTVPERKTSVIECIDRIVAIADGRKVTFNYSVGESMEWVSDEWLSPQKMKEKVEQESFIQSEFGDIYARTIIDSSL